MAFCIERNNIREVSTGDIGEGIAAETRDRFIFPRPPCTYSTSVENGSPFSGATNGVIGSARDIETEFNAGA